MIETFINLDARILLWIQENLRIAWLNPIMILITTLGNKGIIWILMSLSMVIWKKTRKIGIICLLSLVLCLLINNVIIKNLVMRQRPFDVLNSVRPLIPRPTDFSFPSGHSAASFACGWVMYKKMPKKYGIAALILAILIAFSRLYVGVHYPTDVIAGIVIGITISYLANFIFEMFLHYKKIEGEI